MVDTNTTTVEQALTPLLGLPLRTFGRAAGLLWMHFGQMRRIPSHRGGTKQVGDWALHVQCAWRLCRQEQIEMASLDYYYNFKGDWLEDWDKPGNSRFDVIATALMTRWQWHPLLVQLLTTDEVGGFSLYLTEGYRLDVYPNHSGGQAFGEYWRLFEPGTNHEHFVMP